MPIPTPSDGETREDFIGRCNSALADEFPDADQRNAVCATSWREQHQRPGSHRLTVDGDRVTVHDLELFVGFDPTIDDPDNTRIRKYDRDRVLDVVNRTQEFIRRGQSPKLIVGHNSLREAGNDRPTIGDIPRLEFSMIGDAPGIVGDVEMTASNFDAYLRSNSWPRRSAEIHPDLFLSEVALLGSRTPARPLPDTKFDRDGAECFARDLPALQFEADMNDPGSGNVNPAGRRRSMDDEKKDQLMDEDEKDDEYEEKDKDEMARLRHEVKLLNSRLQKVEEERDRLQTKVAKFSRDNQHKDTGVRALELERDEFERRTERQNDRIAALEGDLRREQFGRKLDDAVQMGYRVGDDRMRAQVLERIVKAEEPEVEFKFLKQMWHRDPIETRVNQNGAIAGGASADEMEKQKAAAAKARDRALDEDKPEEFGRFYQEELAHA